LKVQCCGISPKSPGQRQQPRTTRCRDRITRPSISAYVCGKDGSNPITALIKPSVIVDKRATSCPSAERFGLESSLSSGFLNRRSQVRVLSGPPIKSDIYFNLGRRIDVASCRKCSRLFPIISKL